MDETLPAAVPADVADDLMPAMRMAFPVQQAEQLQGFEVDALVPRHSDYDSLAEDVLVAAKG
jgi:hypothetical protein